MLKIKHVLAVPLLALLSVVVSAGCAMDAGSSIESVTEPAAEQESTDESSAELAAGGKWRIYDSERCEEMCQGSPFGCGCVNIPRCTTRTPQGRVCPTLGKFCFVEVGGMGNTYRCQ
jgi:hypothetical protein